MPWEKTFDVETALDRAADVFSAKGYEATSMSDLIKGTGVNKGSLYNAFGSKKDLFKAVLVHFERNTQRPTFARLASLGDPVAAITMVFDNIVGQSVAGIEDKGNLVITTALELPYHDADVQEVAIANINNLEVFFRQMIESGQGSGAIAAELDPVQTAKALVSMTVGLRVLARGSFDAAGLHAVKASVTRLLGG